MKEIKFRQPLWDKHNKFAGWHYWGFINNQFVEPEFTPFSSLTEAKEQSQQFTGKYDKKCTKECPEGQEIYEGDIARWNNRIGKKEYQDSIWLVVWNEVYAKFTVKYKGSGKNTDSIFPLFTKTDLEVIGNIYENPELLQGGKEGGKNE